MERKVRVSNNRLLDEYSEENKTGMSAYKPNKVRNVRQVEEYYDTDELAHIKKKREQENVKKLANIVLMVVAIAVTSVVVYYIVK